MRSLLFVLLQICLLTALGLWFSQNPGYVQLEWLGYRLETSMGILLGTFGAGALVAYGLGFFLLGIFRIPSFLRSRYRKYNHIRGLHAVEDSLSAWIAQDPKGLKRASKFVGSFLKDSPLNYFFRAEGAFLEHNLPKAKKLFEILTKTPAMAFVGYYGLLRLALINHNTEQALYYGKLALTENPHSFVAHKKMVALALALNKYEEALEHLTLLLNHSPSPDLKAQRGRILVTLATQAKNQKDKRRAYTLIKQALEDIPSDYVAVCLYSQLLKEDNKPKQALRVLEEGWEKSPHASFLPLYLELKEIKTPLEAFKAVQRLVSYAPTHEESLFATAEYALKANLWGLAQEAITQLSCKNNPSDRVTALQNDLRVSEIPALHTGSL